MTFQEWSDATGIHSTHPTTECGAISVSIYTGHAQRAELWKLSDYKVSSASGSVVWLTPYKGKTMDPAQTLIDAEIARTTDPAACAQLLAAYFLWRIKGGFQPQNGDDTATYLLERLGEDGQNCKDRLDEHSQQIKLRDEEINRLIHLNYDKDETIKRLNG